jgi:hypothetical protein
VKRVCVSFLIMIVICGAASAADLGTRKLIPEGCIAVITVSNVNADPGISWMLSSWLASSRKSPLKDLLKTTAPQELSVAFFPESAAKPVNVLVIMAVPKAAALDKAKLDAIVMEGEAVKLETKTYKSTVITYAAGATRPVDYGAYALVGNSIIFGVDADLVQKAIDGPSASASPNYQKIVSQAAPAKDALLFADNAGAKFASFLAPREKKWNLTLLLAAESLAYMGSTFDVVDSSKVSGSIIFQAADKAKLADVKDDAEFIGEAFKRKFIADKIGYTGKVEVNDLTVKLTFQIEGLEPLWKKLFDKGVMELFKPGS